MPKGYIGIDIGTRQVKMVQCRDHVLYREETEPLPEYFVNNGKLTSMELMAEFLKKMAKTYGFRCRSCCLVLPDQVTFTRRLRMPAMPVNHLKINLPYEFHDFIRDKRETYIFDYAVMDLVYDEKKKPVSMDLMAAAVSKRVMEEYRQMLRLAGWKLKAAAPAAFAYSNLIREYEKRQGIEEPGDYCFVDLGDCVTKVLFFRGMGLEACRRIENCQIAGEGFGFYESMGMEIKKTLQFYHYRNQGRRINEIYFCGGRAMEEHFCETVTEYVSLKQEYVGELISTMESRKRTVISPAAAGITFYL